MRLPPIEEMFSKPPSFKTIFKYISGGLVLLIATAFLINTTSCKKKPYPQQMTPRERQDAEKQSNRMVAEHNKYVKKMEAKHKKERNSREAKKALIMKMGKKLDQIIDDSWKQKQKTKKAIKKFSKSCLLKRCSKKQRENLCMEVDIAAKGVAILSADAFILTVKAGRFRQTVKKFRRDCRMYMEIYDFWEATHCP